MTTVNKCIFLHLYVYNLCVCTRDEFKVFHGYMMPAHFCMSSTSVNFLSFEKTKPMCRHFPYQKNYSM